MELRHPPLRITLLLAVAVLMVGLVLLDQFGYLPGGGDESSPRRRLAAQSPMAVAPPPSANAPSPAASAPVAALAAHQQTHWQQLAARYAELKGYVEAKDDIERAYTQIGGPYAEAIASYGATYPAGNRPGESLDRFIRQHLSSRLRLVDLKIMPSAERGSGRYVSTAQISLLAADSQAMIQAVLDLGNPDNGLLWKELTVTADATKKTMRADGQLVLTLVESAE
jgi:hypothetical protein